MVAAEATRERPRSLWRQRDFALLWSGSLISELGSSVTDIALPLTAVVVLRASTFDVGLLTSIGSLPFLLVALPVGVLVDRVRKRGLMLTADFCRGLILACVPLAAVLGILTLWQLYAVALTAGLLTVVFDVSYQSFVPALLERDQLVAGNTKLGLPSSLANVIGPSVGGSLVAALTAPTAIVVDAASFMLSGAVLALIRVREQMPRMASGQPARRTGAEIREGLSYLFGHPVLRRIVACTAMSNLFTAMRSALTMVFLVRVLHADAATVGLVVSLASLGGLTGAFVSGWLGRRVGPARLLWLGKAMFGWIALAIPLAQPGAGVFLVSVGSFAASMSAVVYNINQLSYRQAVCPQDLLGRLNSAVRWVISGVLPIGAFLGGALGSLVGIRPTLVVAVLGSWCAVLWIVCSPLRREREIPVHAAYAG